MLKVATWNVNSVRSRLDRVVAWLEKEAPSILCLQETKCTDDVFPYDAFEAAGYHAAVFGQKSYNGVAIVSREAPEEVRCGWDGGFEDEQARLIHARLGDVDVVSAYVPNGSEPGTDKWDYKLMWLDHLRAYVDRSFTPDDALIVCGDFNVAPEARDVARPDAWRGSVLFHPEGTRALETLVAWGLEDVVRRHDEGPGPFTWWDYRSMGFQRNDGLRIDHLFATPALAARSTAAYVDRDERKGEKPSDHAPVVAVFDV